MWHVYNSLVELLQRLDEVMWPGALPAPVWVASLVLLLQWSFVVHAPVERTCHFSLMTRHQILLLCLSGGSFSPSLHLIHLPLLHFTCLEPGPPRNFMHELTDFRPNT